MSRNFFAPFLLLAMALSSLAPIAGATTISGTCSGTPTAGGCTALEALSCTSISGCGLQGGQCSGTPNSGCWVDLGNGNGLQDECEGISKDFCYGSCPTSGYCSWNIGTCHGTPSSCSLIPHEDPCTTVGCTWTPDTCDLTNGEACDPGDPAPDCCIYGLTCTGGKCVAPNLPPGKPDKPAITSLELSQNPPYPLTTIGHATCTANCPPSPLPKDPETNSDAAMQYRWYLNGNAAGIWDNYADFDCSANHCAFGDTVALGTRACDALGACSESDKSAQLSVKYPPPADPDKPVLASPVTIATTAKCTNCPLISTDPVTGGPAEIDYAWVKNGAADGWSSAYSGYSCLANNCAEGQTLALKARTCNSASPQLCSHEVSSDPLTVKPESHGTGAGVDMSYCIYAIAAAIFALALAYIASYAFNLPHIRPIIQDEGLQVLATGAVLLSIIGVNAFIDGYMVSTLGAAKGSATQYAGITSAMDAAGATLSTLEGNATSIYGNLEQTSIDLGREASEGIYCNFLGVGFSLVNCSPLNAFRGSLTTAAFATSAALADIYAQQALLSLARDAAFAFLIPLGLFFRCFKTSRGAGGALIAIGFGFYTAYPVMIVANANLLHGSNPSSPSIGLPSVGTCDPSETNVDVSRGQMTGFAGKLTDFGLVESTEYVVLVRIILSSILDLIVTLGFIRAFAHILGSEIDISALARIS